MLLQEREILPQVRLPGNTILVPRPFARRLAEITARQLALMAPGRRNVVPMRSPERGLEHGVRQANLHADAVRVKEERVALGTLTLH